MKAFLILLALLALNSCVSTQQHHYYILSTASEPSVHYRGKKSIGVEKVTLPAYLHKRELAVATSSSQIVLRDNAVWGEDLDTGLTARLIGFLQKKFHQPNVYLYPWNVDRKPDRVVFVHITRFIAQGNKVYLDATWGIENMKTKNTKEALFTTSVSTTEDTQSIVSSMDKAFSELEERVAMGLKHF